MLTLSSFYLCTPKTLLLCQLTFKYLIGLPLIESHVLCVGILFAPVVISVLKVTKLLHTSACNKRMIKTIYLDLGMSILIKDICILG